MLLGVPCKSGGHVFAYRAKSGPKEAGPGVGDGGKAHEEAAIRLADRAVSHPAVQAAAPVHPADSGPATRPLDAAMRRHMEARLHGDFSRVRDRAVPFPGYSAVDYHAAQRHHDG